jgi:predicted RNA polymerase sigma factor
VLASLVGFLADVDRPEEAAQAAFAIAVERWPPWSCARSAA